MWIEVYVRAGWTGGWDVFTTRPKTGGGEKTDLLETFETYDEAWARREIVADLCRSQGFEVLCR